MHDALDNQSSGYYDFIIVVDPIYFIQDLAVILLSAALCGFICSRIGLSPIVGYLTAGLIVGTPEITVPYVTDESRIHIIAQLGVVFLMFGIGLQFSLRKLKELGLGVMIATALTALLVLTAVRLAFDLLGLSAGAGLCLAAVFMVSSSAIIGKVLEEQRFNQRRFGKIALGMTLMEDIVAVIMLAVLGSYVAAETGDVPALGLLLAMLLGFVVTAVVLGLVIVPKLLKHFERFKQIEISNIFVCGALLSLAFAAFKAGYSLALGAFIFGIIVAETRQRGKIERAFVGLKDVFLTVFFVTIGMLIDVRLIPAALPWIALGTAGALLGRMLAAFISLAVVGEHPRVALRAALCLTPIGEFSFIIAGIGVASGLFSESFQVIAVGTSLATCLIAPILIKSSDWLTQIFSPESAPRLDRWYGNYAAFWSRIGPSGPSGQLWMLMKKRLFQVAREMLLISALFLFADPIFREFVKPRFPAFEFGVLFWFGIGVVCLFPMVAVWRNLSAMAMIISDYLLYANKLHSSFATVIKHLLHVFYVFILALWLWNILPDYLIGWQFLVGFLAVSTFVMAVAMRVIIRWYSRLENALDEALEDTQTLRGRELEEARRGGRWNYELEEISLPDDTAFAGAPLGSTELRSKTGAQIVGIERNEFTLPAIDTSTLLFPGDRLLLLGSREQLNRAREHLSVSSDDLLSRAHLQDLTIQTMQVPPQSPMVTRTLADLSLPRKFSLQVVAIRRANGEEAQPEARTEIQPLDNLLLLGNLKNFSRFNASAESGIEVPGSKCSEADT
ncbi:MAG: hypothetical protein EA353_08150 [Puniceicoccaceae bacterium]|nr:MAG: hypothetical protein EA353_08150 [Puniceicoccaceae bacterium]